MRRAGPECTPQPQVTLIFFCRVSCKPPAQFSGAVCQHTRRLHHSDECCVHLTQYPSVGTCSCSLGLLRMAQAAISPTSLGLNMQLQPAAPAHGAGRLAHSRCWSAAAAAAAPARLRQAGGVARPALPARVAARRAGGAPSSSSGDPIVYKSLNSACMHHGLHCIIR